MLTLPSPAANPREALRALEFIYAELGLFFRTSKLLLPAVVLAQNTNVSADLLFSFKHLNVTVQNIILPYPTSQGQLQQVAAASAGHQAQWVLIVTDTLKPMEYWLWNLMARLLSSTAPIKAAKSLTLNNGGSIKSAGLQHQVAVIGDGKTLVLPFMLYR